MFRAAGLFGHYSSLRLFVFMSCFQQSLDKHDFQRHLLVLVTLCTRFIFFFGFCLLLIFLIGMIFTKYPYFVNIIPIIVLFDLPQLTFVRFTVCTPFMKYLFIYHFTSYFLLPPLTLLSWVVTSVGSNQLEIQYFCSNQVI